MRANKSTRNSDLFKSFMSKATIRAPSVSIDAFKTSASSEQPHSPLVNRRLSIASSPFTARSCPEVLPGGNEISTGVTCKPQEATQAPSDHKTDEMPPFSNIKASSSKSTQAVPVTSVESTQTEAPPATSNQSTQTSPPADVFCAHAVPKPEVTIADAFGYTFSEGANIETARQMFQMACADHVFCVNSYKREDFISSLKEKLRYRAAFQSKEFFQVFMNISAFVHQYVDPGLDYDVAAAFAHAQIGPKWHRTTWLKPRMQCEFSDGMQAVYLCYTDYTRMLHLLPAPGTYVQTDYMRTCAQYNAKLIKVAGHCVDPRKVRLDRDVSVAWQRITADRRRA